MHELSIALSLIEVACEEAERRGARIAALHVRVGPLSGVVKEALASAYELAREGTPLEQARLEIEETPILIDCRACRAQRLAASIYEMSCAVCGAPASDVVGGRELELIALEIE